MPAHLAGGKGLSPRVRGNGDRRHQRRSGERSIPARAGERFHPCPYWPVYEVYPRVCGEGGEGVWASWWGCELGLGP